DVRKKLKSRIEKAVKHARSSTHSQHKTSHHTTHTSIVRKDARQMPKENEPIGRFAFREEAERVGRSAPELIVTGKPHWLADIQTRVKELESQGEFNLPEKDRWELSRLKSTLRKMNTSMDEVHEKAFE
ncbi:MAG: hypothetical protein Q7K42_00465, partial [Candidatus Diapherotrites archaeon]|nr:hypothetical protein [Candidatus Diapherotrites archaeon]